MDMADKQQPKSRIDLSADSQWCEFSIGGQAFECEAFEVAELLADIDHAHRYDPHTCGVCYLVVPANAEAAPSELRCAACGEKSKDKIRFSQVYLDDVAKLLRERFGLARVSRTEAWRFYDAIASTIRDLKKNLGSTAKSDTVLESIPEAGLPI